MTAAPDRQLGANFVVMNELAEKFLPGDVITSVSKYLAYIDGNCTNFSNVLFRGHRVENWSLLPKIAWLPLPDDEDLLSIEQSMLREGALKNQVQHLWEKMLHGKTLWSVGY